MGNRPVNEQEILRHMARLGVADFETVGDGERQQKKFIRNLRGTSIARRRMTASKTAARQFAAATGV